MKKSSHFEWIGIDVSILSKILLKMKLITILICVVGLLGSYASGFSQSSKLSIKLKDASVKEILKTIEQQSEYSFMYDNNKIDVDRITNLDVQNKTVEQILDNIFKGEHVKYRFVNNHVIIVPENSSVKANRQVSKVNGTVKDEAGEPLPGVSVVVKGTTIGITTDFDGKYTLDLPANADILVFSFVGMKSQEIVLEGQSVINITMSEDAIGLEEVVAVGYGVQKKVNVTGAVAAVNMDDVTESRPVTNISSALSGMAPGVFVTSSNNRPNNNGNASILVRGQGTLNNSAPLVIIDGVEGSFNSVNPQDVESVSVLKDAASAAIYGSRAANGVILITTKKGKAGKVSFDYSGQLSLQKVGETLNLVTDYATYMELYNEGKRNSGQGEQFSQAKIDEWRNDAGKNPLKYPNTDWQDELFETGFMNQHNLSASGGTDKIHFHISYNYLDNPGVIDNSTYTKHSIRSNIESDVNKWLTFGVQLSGYTSDTEMGAGQLDGVFSYAQASTPGMVLKSPDGRFGTVNNSEDDPQSNNVVRNLYTTDGEDKANSIKTRFYAKLSPLKGLTLHGSYVYDYYDRKRVQKPHFIPVWDFYSNTMVTDGVGRTSIKNHNWNTYRHFMDGYARYETSFVDNQLNFSVFGGASQEQYREDEFSAFRYDLVDPSLGVINGAVGESSTSGKQTEWAMRSFFGRMNLGWNDKYLLEVNLRADASSRFLSNERWGYFPSFSVGWRMTEEDFLSDVEWLTNLKLRGSYGSLGNNSVGDYDAISVYSTRNYVLNNNTATGLAQGAIANANLTWESTYITDIGVDFGFLNNRLTGSLDYFDKVTKDILINLPAPDVHGTASIPKQNAAQVSNKGFELSLGYRGKVASGFEYGVSGNVTYVKNNVDKFKGDVASYSGDKQILEGRPVNEKYVLQFERIVQTDADVARVNEIIANAPTDEQGNKMNPFAAFGKPEKGDILFADTNGDGLINNDDRIMTGYNNLPKWTYGINLTAAWKGFDFGALIQGSVGARESFKNYNHSSSIRYGYQINADVADGRYYDGRNVTNDPASFPRLLESSLSGKNNERNSTFWMYKKSYMRIKNIQLGYTVPTRVLNGIKLDGLSKVRLYCSLENFFTFSDWPGLDPEVSGVNYPVMKQAVFGLNVSF
ncbi:SusC/RagA family TonB-linked outer membrane protein [Puteibacter caeruleilacunae]|nr:SusC/RagA family TonB-linked outer membrane protein [Puteibacter caeruleilacunae]